MRPQARATQRGNDHRHPPGDILARHSIEPAYKTQVGPRQAILGLCHLLDPDPDVPLDLDTVVTAVYKRGAYARERYTLNVV